MTELSFALLLFVWWIIAVSLLTADDAVASTIQGGQPIPLIDNGGSSSRSSSSGSDARRSMMRMLVEEDDHDDFGTLGFNVTNITNANITTICECWNQTNTTTHVPDEDENESSSPKQPTTYIFTSKGSAPVFPGNNLFLALWLGLYCSAKICLKWKAARAMVQMSDAMRRDAEACEDLIGDVTGGGGSGGRDGLVVATKAKSGNHRRERDNEDDVD